MSYESEVRNANDAIADADALVRRLADEIDRAEKSKRARDASAAIVDAGLPKLEKDLDAIAASLDASASVNAKVKDSLDRIDAEAASLVAQVSGTEYIPAGADFIEALRERVLKAVPPRVAALRERARQQTNEYSKYGKKLKKAADFLARAKGAADPSAAATALDDAEEKAADTEADLAGSQLEVIRAHFSARIAELRAGIAAFRADLASGAKSSKDRPGDQSQDLPPLQPGVFPDSIAGSGMKVINDKIGGTTGAKLVEIDGRRYILKTAGKVSPEHVRSEAAADQAYRLAGIRVPDCRIYEEDGKIYKLSEYIAGGKSLRDYMAKATPAQRQAVIDELKQGYIVDTLFANWDVLGTDQDNVLVDGNGHAWRIDNGSSFGFRAQGSRKKPEEWEKREWPDEWRTLRTSPINRGVFDKLTAHDIFSSKVDLDAVAASLPEDARKAIAKPLAELKQMQSRCADFDQGRYTPAHTSAILEHSYDFCKLGMREALPKSIPDFHVDDPRLGWLRPGSTSSDARSNTAIAGDILSAVKSIKHHIDIGDTKPNMEKVHAALAHKNDLALASKWDPNAQKLLSILDAVDASAATKFKSIDDVKVDILPVNLAGPDKGKSGAAPRYSCFADMVEKMGAQQGIDVSRAIVLFKEQGHNSSTAGSCKAKILEMEALGIDPRNPPPECYIRGGVSGVLSHYGSHPGEHEADRRALELWKAATQVLLENTGLPFKDDATRTVRLMRTGKFSEAYPLRKGVIADAFPEGAHESYGTFHDVVITGHDLIIRDVPFSRITSTYLTTSKAGVPLYLGDRENEFGANTIGLPVYYHGKTNGGVSFEKYTDEITAAEKKSGRTLRDIR